MFRLEVTPKSWEFIQNEHANLLKMLMCLGGIIEEADGGKKQLVYNDTHELNIVWNLARYLYEALPNEDNRWITPTGETKSLTDIKTLRKLQDAIIDNFSGVFIALPDIIKNHAISTVEELKKLADTPFVGFWRLSEEEILELSWEFSVEASDNRLKFDHAECTFSNRLITHDIECSRGTIELADCVITGNVEISSADRVYISHCVILGLLRITGSEKVLISGSNIAHAQIYNSNLDWLHFEYSKFYWLVMHSSTIERFDFFYNKVYYPYLTNITLPDKFKIDTSQFVTKNINHSTIETITKTSKPKIRKKKEFFLTFMFQLKVSEVTGEDISYDMANIFLTKGDLSKFHNLYSQLNYEKALYSNKGLKRFFVFVTGAFYKPMRWVLYLLVIAVVFAILYGLNPCLYFTNVVTAEKEQLSIDMAIYFSVCQIISANPTAYVPVGITVILVSLQSLINTSILASMIASFIKKYLRDSL